MERKRRERARWYWHPSLPQPKVRTPHCGGWCYQTNGVDRHNHGNARRARWHNRHRKMQPYTRPVKGAREDAA
jgi:hypothetical protein